VRFAGNRLVILAEVKPKMAAKIMQNGGATKKIKNLESE